MNDLTRRPINGMRKSGLERKPQEKGLKRSFHSIHKLLNSNNLGGDDPCELRQTGGYRFAFASRIDIVVLIKSSLIDSETYVMQEAA